MHKILREDVKILGSGRTDAGVHALGQTANFHTCSAMPAYKLQAALNSLLPDDIAVIRAQDAPCGFHSRFGARSKTYRYTILNRPGRAAIGRHTVFHCRYALDVELMAQEAAVLLGRHDFSSFQSAGARNRGSVRTISALIVRREEDRILIDIIADGFLYSMVRTIVGTLIEAGRGRMPPGSVKKILDARNRRLAGPTAPAKGLCLMEVRYYG